MHYAADVRDVALAVSVRMFRPPGAEALALGKPSKLFLFPVFISTCVPASPPSQS